MSPRLPARLRRRVTFVAVLATALLATMGLGGLALAGPAAASTSVVPVTRPTVKVTPADQKAAVGHAVYVTVTASQDGSALSGTVAVAFLDPKGGEESRLTAPASDFVKGKGVSITASGPGVHSVRATFTPSGVGASVVGTSTYNAKYIDDDLAISFGNGAADEKLPVTATVTMPSGTAGAGGTVTVYVDAGVASASCAPTPQTATSAGCVAMIPAGLTPGIHQIQAAFDNSPTYFDTGAFQKPVSIAPATASTSGTTGTSGTSGSGSSGGSGTKSGTTAATTAPSAISLPSATADSSPPGLVQADPASSSSRAGGTDPLLLVISTVGACAALGTLGVAISLLIRRRRDTPEPKG